MWGKETLEFIYFLFPFLAIHDTESLFFFFISLSLSLFAFHWVTYYWENLSQDWRVKVNFFFQASSNISSGIYTAIVVHYNMFAYSLSNSFCYTVWTIFLCASNTELYRVFFEYPMEMNAWACSIRITRCCYVYLALACPPVNELLLPYRVLMDDTTTTSMPFPRPENL